MTPNPTIFIIKSVVMILGDKLNWWRSLCVLYELDSDESFEYSSYIETVIKSEWKKIRTKTKV